MPLLNRRARRLLRVELVKPYNPREDGITPSIMRNFLECPVSGMYTIQGLTPKALINRMRFGNICHHINDCLYTKCRGCSDFLDSTTELALTEYEQILHRDGDTGKRVETDLAKAEAVMKQYGRAYPSDFSYKDFIAAEMIMDVPWMGFRLRGKIDGIYRDKNGKIWILETKTKGRIRENLAITLGRDLQNQFYMTMYEIKTGKQVEGILYTAPHQNENLLSYKMRLYNDIGANRPHYFKRLELYYTDRDRELYRSELLEKLAMIEGYVMGTRSVYHNETHCEDCDYMDICINGNSGPYIQQPLFNELRKAA